MWRGYADPAHSVSGLSRVPITSEQTVHGRQSLTRLQCHAFTKTSDMDLPGVAMKQGLAEQLFKLLHCAGNGLRRRTQAAGRLPEAGSFGGTAENTE